jgi:hypothetical protein
MTLPCFSKWPPAAILDFEIELDSLDKKNSMALRNFHAKGDLCNMS